MNKKLLNSFFLMVIIGQLHAMTFLIPWNGNSIGNHLDNFIVNLIVPETLA